MPVTVERKPGDERWGRYPETILMFSGDAEVAIDLREEIPPPARRALTAMGLGAPFGILTAFNPRGIDLSSSENASRMDALEKELASAGETFVRLDACSPDRSHCECSVALIGPRARCIDVARRWDQIAIFWWDGLSFWLYGAIVEAEPLKLPM